MLQILNAKILAGEREREIRRRLREHAIRREAEAAMAESSARVATVESRASAGGSAVPGLPAPRRRPGPLIASG